MDSNLLYIIIIGRHAHVCIEPTSLNFTDTSRSDKLDLNKWGDTSELTLAEEQERRTGPLFQCRSPIGNLFLFPFLVGVLQDSSKRRKKKEVTYRRPLKSRTKVGVYNFGRMKKRTPAEAQSFLLGILTKGSRDSLDLPKERVYS